MTTEPATHPPRTLTVAIAGASGFMGTTLARHLLSHGHGVRRIGRGHDADFQWDPGSGRLDAAALDGADAVVNLSGANIGQRWTRDHKRAIVESRVRSTELLARTLAVASSRPRVFIATSAVGIYGDRGDEVLDDSSPPGGGFLAGLVRQWEAAAAPARDAGIRVVHPRFAPVLNPEGGMLAKLIPIFNLGGGGKIGKGTQWLSWVALTDAMRATSFLIETETLEGAVNVSSPNPITNAEFARTLAEVLRRPALAAVPAFAVKLLYGEMGEETVLAGQRVLPRRLTAAGFAFAFPELAAALRHEIGAH